MVGKHWAKVSKRGITERKRAKIENPYLNAHLHISMISHSYFQENPSNGLGGVAITKYVKYVCPYFLRSTFSSFMNLLKI